MAAAYCGAAKACRDLEISLECQLRKTCDIDKLLVTVCDHML